MKHHILIFLLLVILSAQRMHLPVIAIPAAFKLVKDAVVLIERAQLTPQVLMDL